MYKMIQWNLLIVAVIAALVGCQSGNSQGNRDSRLANQPVSRYDIVEGSIDDQSPLSHMRYVMRSSGTAYQDPAILDSFETVCARMCDTNAASYLAIGDSVLHLVVVRLSPVVHRDTVLTLYGHTASVSLGEIANFALCLSKGLLALQFCSDNPCCTVVGRLDTRGRSFVRTDSLSMTSTLSTAADYSQILIGLTEATREGPTGRSLICVFDSTSDTPRVLTQLMGSNMMPVRLNLHSPLFYLKRGSDGNQNVWKYSETHGETRITNVARPGSVIGLQLKGEYVTAVVSDGNSHKLNFITGIPADE